VTHSVNNTQCDIRGNYWNSYWCYRFRKCYSCYILCFSFSLYFNSKL